jgi:hypothetical protein
MLGENAVWVEDVSVVIRDGFTPLAVPTFTETPPSFVLAGPWTSPELRATALGNPAPTLQWYRNGQIITGATAPALWVSGSGAFGSEVYRLVATNAIGTAFCETEILRQGSIYEHLSLYRDPVQTWMSLQAGSDNDGDGVLNALEIFFNTDPTRANQVPYQLTTLPGGTLRFRFTRSRAVASAQYIIESSPNLVNWSQVQAAEVVESRNGDTEYMYIDLPAGLSLPRFVRVRLVTF